MLQNKIGYSYNDVTLVPSVISSVSSRSECNPFIKDNFLPIFTAPMASVVNFENYKTFLDNGITPIIPRNISLEVRKDLMNNQQWVALSLKEFENLFIDNYQDRIGDFRTHYFICVDIANGHMKSLYDKCAKAKNLAKDNSYRLTIMTGNIANAKTYEWISKNSTYLDKNGKRKCAIDFIRVGIGGGAGCFIDGTQIKTINGEKNIEDIQENDKVLTIDGTYQKVLNTTRFKSNELIKINNEITSTINHKYFVINKEDKDKVNENNLQKYGYWIEANNLDKSKHLLIKKYEIIEFIEIESIEYINDLEWVNDITVETNHNYIANGYLVHNCITSSNVSIHYPQASLINECYQVKQDLENETLKQGTYDERPKYNYDLPKIVADGGIRNYDHVIKALALGADYVMIGSLFAQCIESAGSKVQKDVNRKLPYIKYPLYRYNNFSIDNKGYVRGYYTEDFIKESIKPWKDSINKYENKESSKYKLEYIKYKDRLNSLKEEKCIGQLEVKFFGMASADGQKSISGVKTKTAEGITKYLPIKYTLKGWTENMISYLRSAMSYTDCKTLNKFIGNQDLIINSISEIQAVNK